ncbi:coatomer alpha subunit protein [Cryptosporidium andersoni]|uniref:Coatomer alpha subunit protein n=1 Tax=Cryptosporidium andersoni TaxID=117008 RepID=A0A1J4MW93_9CRYT|nr:coatomer alpha subunit protein [Cryptosporidium andersoni]
MLIRCESKSTRVKGLSFHPKLPWILVSLHNGIIQFWDYRLGSLLDTYEEHEGPVRSVDFHESQPIFVSGGDDYRVKVWNYKERRCLFTLIGHLDYIRTVEFHKEYPWILSSSDDQTMRLWNWQSRACIAVITGHNHYVMCSKFHPHQDLIVSASMDQSIRIWDFTGLREKTVKGHSSLSTITSSISNTMPAHSDMFGANDVICKFVLEGHERGVNWVTFHPTLSLIASASDDRTIKLWRYSETKAWEIDTLRGHFNNVSSVIFHTSKDWLLSDSEDRTIRIWDLTKRVPLHTYKREGDRFWAIVSHPTSSLFAAGHDSGMMIFKLEMERLPSDIIRSMKQVWYIFDKYLYMYDIKNNTTTSIMPLKNPNLTSNTLCPYQLSINPYSPNELCFVIYYKKDFLNGSSGNISSTPTTSVNNTCNSLITYDIVTTPISDGSLYDQNLSNNMTWRNGLSSVISLTFIARNRFIALESGGQTISIVSLEGDILKRWDLPWIAQKLYSASSQQHVIIQSDDVLYLYDINQRDISAELVISNIQNHQVAVINTKMSPNAPQCLSFICGNPSDPSSLGTGIRSVEWSTDRKLVAIVFKYNIIFADSKLQILAIFTENLTVKSGTWHSTLPLYIYTTLGHIKYAIPTLNERGIIETVSDVFYIQYFEDSRSDLITLNRFGKIQIIEDINLHEALFKISISKQQDNIICHIEHGNLKGLSTLNYLTQHGYPEIAIRLVENPILKFYYAIQFGEISQAYNILSQLQHNYSGSNNSFGISTNGTTYISNNSFNSSHKTILPKLNSNTLLTMWKSLSHNALTNGFVNIAEKCLQVVKELEQLALLYYVIGQRENLAKLARISEKQKNWSRKFHISLLLGDIEERISVLRKLGQIPLAIATAYTYGFHDLQQELLTVYKESYCINGDHSELVKELESVVSNCSNNLISPCIPILGAKNLPHGDINWPIIKNQTSPHRNYQSEKIVESYSKDIDRGDLIKSASKQTIPSEWDIDSIDVHDEFPDQTIDLKESNCNVINTVDKSHDYSAPGDKEVLGISTEQRILSLPNNLPTTISRNSIINLIIGGKYYDSLSILQRKLGAKNLKPFYPIFRSIVLSSYYNLPSICSNISLSLPFISSESKLFGNQISDHVEPMILYSESAILDIIKTGQRFVTNGKFSQALKVFQELILIIPLIIEHHIFYSRSTEQFKQLLELCSQYVIGMRLELSRTEMLTSCSDQNDSNIIIRNLELISYFTCCHLQPLHLSLVLRRAMGIAWKYQNYITAANFAKRLLTMQNIDDIEKTQKVLLVCEQKATDQYLFNFDPIRDVDHLLLCCSSLKKIDPQVHSFVKCPVCNSTHLVEFTGSICSNCGAGEIGLRVLGIV